MGSLLRIAVRAILRRIDLGDPWDRFESKPTLRAFGSGNRHEFRWYLDGESQVAVASIEDVCTWLLACQYQHDRELFWEADFWQHPCTFEQLRKGDCEDHALWAWRKLAELGVDVEFIAGQSRFDTGTAGGHAWVVFRQGGEEFLLESVAHTRDTMIQPLADVRYMYVPCFSMRGDLRGFTFNGFLYALAERMDEAFARVAAREAPAA